jgi:hypothetical protein
LSFSGFSVLGLWQNRKTVFSKKTEFSGIPKNRPSLEASCRALTTGSCISGFHKLAPVAQLIRAHRNGRVGGSIPAKWLMVLNLNWSELNLLNLPIIHTICRWAGIYSYTVCSTVVIVVGRKSCHRKLDNLFIIY